MSRENHVELNTVLKNPLQSKQDSHDQANLKRSLQCILEEYQEWKVQSQDPLDHKKAEFCARLIAEFRGQSTEPKLSL